MHDALSGAVFGLAAGLMPGPLLALVIQQTLRHGPTEGIKVAAAPLLTDLPIVAAALFAVNRVADADDLYRQAKSEATLRGRCLRGLIEEGLQRVLGLPASPPCGHRMEFPLHRHTGRLSPADVNRAENEVRLDEDASHVGAG